MNFEEIKKLSLEALETSNKIKDFMKELENFDRVQEASIRCKFFLKDDGGDATRKGFMELKINNDQFLNLTNNHLIDLKNKDNEINLKLKKLLKIEA